MMDLGLRFQDPLWLWASLAGPLVVLVAVLRERGGPAVVFPGAARLKGVPPGLRARLRHLPVLVAGLGLSTGAVALARPQHGTLREDVTTQGVDIVIALDVSGSMAAEDFQPRNRLEVAKDVVAGFVTRRTHDRVGLVVFAGKSLTKAPPTTDTTVLLRQLEDVRLEMLPEGTAIGSGLATSLTRLRRSQAKSKVIVLVTDGANNAGEIDPATATDLARAMEVRVYSVLVGLGGLAEVPIDEGLLKTIAERTGGEFFRAEDSASLRRIFERIDQLEKTEIRHSAYRRFRELFVPVLVAAATLLAAAAALWASGLRVAP